MLTKRNITKSNLDFDCSFYKGLVPLWARQIPYTMMKFSCFERTLEALYKYVVPKPRSECNKSEQLMVTFTAGYIGKWRRVVEYKLCSFATSRGNIIKVKVVKNLLISNPKTIPLSYCFCLFIFLLFHTANKYDGKRKHHWFERIYNFQLLIDKLHVS